jgi:hypothetical protein
VSLSLSASDAGGVSSMDLSNDGVNWSAWGAYATTKAWKFAGANGTKTRTPSTVTGPANVSATVCDTIMLDKTPPSVSAMSPKNASFTADTTPTIKATVRDNLTDLQKTNVKLYVNGVLISSTKYSYSAATDVLTYNSPKVSKSKKTVRIVATDAAGNVVTKSWYFTINAWYLTNR